jgi:glutamate-1-semialdehyde 2,1-aminomutase
MSVKPIDRRPHDRQVWEEELEAFVPSRLFDAHCHLFDRAHLPELKRAGAFSTNATLSRLREWGEALYPGRKLHCLLLGNPAYDVDVDAQVAFYAENLRGQPHERVNRLVTPRCKLDTIARDLDRPGFVGLKPYRRYSVTGDINQCRIHEFLPHEQLELANQRGLWVTMHLSRYHGCADEMNLADLYEFTTRRYPKVRWILAHCARSFTYWPIRRAIDRLRDMPNIWYDLSAVTDALPILTLFQKEDRKRVFWGSDGVEATYFHGRYAVMGRAWATLMADKLDLNFNHTDGRPILCVYEQLLAIKHAAEIAGLSRDEVEDIFWRNASRAFGLADEAWA